MAYFRAGLTAAALTLGLAASATARAEPPPFGVWLVEGGEGAIELAACADANTLCGRLVWLRPAESDVIKRDRKNPDPALRDQPLCGLTLIRGFVQDEGGVWRDGDIYNPDDGHRYAATIRRDGEDRLKLRGYFLLPALGSTQTWTRAPTELTRCVADR